MAVLFGFFVWPNFEWVKLREAPSAKGGWRSSPVETLENVSKLSSSAFRLPTPW